MSDTFKPAVNDPELSARGHLLATTRLISVHPDQCRIHPGNRRDLERAAPHIADLAKSIGESGQLEAAVGRPSLSAERPIELLKGACRHAAVVALNAGGTPTSLWVLVLDDCSNEQAWELITTEQVRTKVWSAWETAEHLDALYQAYGSNKAIHRRLGLDPANIGRARKVTALPQALLDLIVDRHEISARSAAAFMANWNEPKACRRLKIAIGEIAEAYPEKLAADNVFAALTEALRISEDATSAASLEHDNADVPPMPQAAPSQISSTVAIATPPIEQADLKTAASETGAMSGVIVQEDIEVIEGTLARDAMADDRQTDIVGGDDTIIGHAVIHNNGALTLRIASPLADAAAIADASVGIHHALLKLHGVEAQASA